MSDSIEVTGGIVVIGRNEGDRLVRCLASLPQAMPCVYVDSGSRDDSLSVARKAGKDIVALTSPPKFTAARARNAGIDWLRERYPQLRYVMLVDGDCELAPGWMTEAQAAMRADHTLGLVFGRRRERFPQRSIYNALCDDEWNQPAGEAVACGGDVFCHLDRLLQIGGYRAEMIAGEDPDMAVRMRAAGWRLFCLDADMTLHDAAILRFSQWWSRTRRGGHAFGELAARHPRLRQPDWRGQCRSIVVWGVILPGLVLLSLALGFAWDRRWLFGSMLLLGLWPAQLVRLTLKRPDLPRRIAAANAFFLLLGKFAQAAGLVSFVASRLSRSEPELIEYKTV